MRRVVLGLVSSILVGAAWAQSARPPAPPKPAVKASGGARIWLVRDVAQLAEQQVWLFGQDGSSVGVARPEQLRALLSVFGKMEQISGIGSELYLSEGNEPDTWLAQGKGDQVVVRINLGLVTMLGSDWDAWAFVLGHQLAHIDAHQRRRGELEHREIGVPPPPAPQPDEDERVADALALEWAVRAGYKTEGGIRFLTRLAQRHDPAATFMRRHPFYPGRLDFLREAGLNIPAPAPRR